MKKHLLSSFFILLFSLTKLHALTIVSPLLIVVEGSKLCNNLNTTVNPYFIFSGNNFQIQETTIIKSDTSFDIYISHRVANASEGTLDNITTDLEPYFDDIKSRISPEIWKVTTKIFTNDSTLSVYEQSFDPYGQCTEFSNNCDEIIVSRKLFEDICPLTSRTTKSSHNYNGDNLTVYFTDTHSIQVNTCEALGQRIMTDSVVIKDFEAKAYNLTTQTLSPECVTIPCPINLSTYESLGTIDLATCSNVNPIDFNITGSKLCSDLILNFNVPDSLSNFSHNQSIKIDEDTKELSIRYNFTSGTKPPTTKVISTNLTDYIEAQTEFDQTNYTKLINISVQLDDHNSDIGLLRITTHNPCFVYETICPKVNIIRNAIGHAGSIKQASYTIDSDSIVATFDANDEFIVIPFDESARVSNYNFISDTIKIEALESIIYQISAIYLPQNIWAWPFSGIISLPQTEHLGAADFTNCITGIEKDNSQQVFIYPNPASQFININGFDGTVTLYDERGNEYLTSGNEQIAIQDLQSGLYIVNFELNGILHQEKLIIE